MSLSHVSDDQPVIKNLSDFDVHSGSLVERIFFNHRRVVVFICLLLTAFFAWQLSKLQLTASFEKMVPANHPYIVSYLEHQSDLSGQGNAIRIAVEAQDGDIYDADYMETLRQISEEVFLLPGVDRAYMKSLWSPSTRWTGVTEDGLDGGPVIPDDYDGSARALEQLRVNVARSGEIGQLVSFDGRTSILYVPLLDRDASGQALNYAEFADRLEQIRSRFNQHDVHIYITGFAKVVGDLIEGIRQVLLFFIVAIAIAAAMLYWYTRCVRSTLLVVICSLVAVIWQLGLLPMTGHTLGPFSVLVPFLVFAIGMSHGAQKMNGIMQDIGRGTHRIVAARYTFRRLFMAGLTALLCDAVGFAVLMIIDIQAIRELAIIASIGVAVLIFTNLILLPILLSYVGVSQKAAQRSLLAEERELGGGAKHPLWRFLDLFTRRRWAIGTVVVSAGLLVLGYATSMQLKIGDLDQGAPELRADSRYNQDNAFMNANFGASSDVFVVMVETPDGQCSDYGTVMKVDALEWQLRQLPGVEATNSLALLNRRMLTGFSEGSPKWYELLNSQSMVNTITAAAPRGLYNDQCNLLTLYAYLQDHKADTLTRVVQVVEQFAQQNNTDQVRFRLAAGSAGIEAATNIVVKQASREMLLWVYAAVILLCLITFRSWRAVVCAVVPLILTSMLCEALMVWLGIGVKVATLPVIALGVGIGIDYALYVMSVLLARMRAGDSLSQAYYRALLFTGKVVLLTGVTLAIGVATWVFSPIKFQADMGILLAFMFLWNMLGALMLLPALAYFLLPQAAQPVPAAQAEPGSSSAATPASADTRKAGASKEFPAPSTPAAEARG